MQAAAPAQPRTDSRSDGGPIADALASGGDERITLDPETGRNRYGCGAQPCEGLAAFGSSTASVISRSAYEAVRHAMVRLADHPSPREGYAESAERVRQHLARLCGLPREAAADIILAASGTDLHLIAAVLARGEGAAALVTLLPDAAETGRGVPNAVLGRCFAEHTPHGPRGRPGQPLAGMVPGEIVAIPVRETDGTPRSPDAVDADFERAAELALARSPHLLLGLVDVSKTGLVAPSLACAIRLKARFGAAVTVLVDACQFRISNQTLRAYVAHGFLVAVTGSKFLGGPAFSGAMFVPAALATRLRAITPPPALGDYSGGKDWPAADAACDALPDQPNTGLLLLWEAALCELEAFRALPEDEVTAFLTIFASRVEVELDGLAGLERLATPARTRRPGGWDAVPTIFPFLPLRRGAPLDPDLTRTLYGRLLAQGIQLGQPVSIGLRGGRPLTALRLSLSARLIVEALATPGGRSRVTARALRALAAAEATAGEL